MAAADRAGRVDTCRHAPVARADRANVSVAGIAIADTMDTLPDESLVFREGRVDLRQVRKARDALRVAVRVAP